MPIVRMKPAMPGSVMTAPAMRHERRAGSAGSATTDRIALMPRQLVVDEHEDRDQQQAAERGGDAGANRVGAERSARRSAPRGRSRPAGSAPERSISDMSATSCVVKLPKIWPLSVIRPWMVATVSTRLSRMTAIGLPMLSPVSLPNLIGARRGSSRSRPRAGCSRRAEARALRRSRPVTGATACAPGNRTSEPGLVAVGAGDDLHVGRHDAAASPGAAPPGEAAGPSSTIFSSRSAVVPMMRLTWSGSLTPGSCTRIWSPAVP